MWGQAMSRRVYELGDAIRVYVDFTGDDDQPGNPTEVGLRIRRPDGTEGDIPVDHPSVGRYEALIVADMAGLWQVRWRGEGVIQKALRNWFTVAQPRVSDLP